MIRHLIFCMILPFAAVSMELGLRDTSAFAHSDVFLAARNGRVAVGGANELGTIDENFDLDTRVFEGVMIAGFPPFSPADYGRDEPGFNALPAADPALPAGAVALPPSAAVSLNLLPFTVGSSTHSLFYWNGSGAVNFQPTTTVQPAITLSVDPNPLGNTGLSGGLDLHPSFKLDNGGAGIPADGVYLISPTATVSGLTDSDRFYMLWLVDSLMVDEEAAEEFEESLEIGQTVVHGKDFAFFEQAVEFVQATLVPEPTTTLQLIAACGLVAMTRRSRPTHERSAMNSRDTALFIAWVAAAIACPAAATAQHIDVLIQQVDGRLVTGGANFDTGGRTLGRRVYSGEFDSDYAVNSPGFNALAAGSPSLPPGSQALPANSSLSWDFLSMTIQPQLANLFYWNGLESDGQPGITPGDVMFGSLPGPDYAISLFDQSSGKFTVNGADEIVPGGVIGNTASDGSLHLHRFFLLEGGDGSGATRPADGIFLLAMQLRMAGVEHAKPIFMVFGTPGSTVAALDNAAVPWVEQRVDQLVPMAGDYNRDGSVDAADYLLLRTTLGQTGAGLAADGNHDRLVDEADYIVWKANFGAAANAAELAASAVPEPPAAAGFIFAAATALISRRRAT